MNFSKQVWLIPATASDLMFMLLGKRSAVAKSVLFGGPWACGMPLPSPDSSYRDNKVLVAQIRLEPQSKTTQSFHSYQVWNDSQSNMKYLEQNF